MSDSPVPDSERLQRIEWRITDVEVEVRRARRQIPGVLSSMMGTFLGMVLYSIVGIVITILFWSVVVATLTASAAKAMHDALQKQQQTSPARP